MNTQTLSVIALAISLTLAGCDQQAAKPQQQASTATSTSKTDAHADHDHAEHADHEHAEHADHDEHAGHNHGHAVVVGRVDIAGHSVQAKLSGALEPGSEVFIDMTLAGDKALPKAVRAWIGSEDAAQTGKVLIEVGEKGSGHAHIEVPKPLDSAHRLWIELEDAQGKRRGSLELAPTHP